MVVGGHLITTLLMVGMSLLPTCMGLLCFGTGLRAVLSFLPSSVSLSHGTKDCSRPTWL